ncbi:hypothetical protein OLK001_24590 [Synechocystis sp. LKSZ1]
MGLTRGADPYPDHLAPTIHINRDGLVEFGTNGPQALGQFPRSQAMAG